MGNWGDFTRLLGVVTVITPVITGSGAHPVGRSRMMTRRKSGATNGVLGLDPADSGRVYGARSAITETVGQHFARFLRDLQIQNLCAWQHEEAGSLCGTEDLLKIRLVNDDLATLIRNWDAVVEGMKHLPDNNTFKDMFDRLPAPSILPVQTRTVSVERCWASMKEMMPGSATCMWVMMMMMMMHDDDDDDDDDDAWWFMMMIGGVGDNAYNICDVCDIWHLTFE